MRFCLIYPNNPELRKNIEGFIINLINQGVDFSKQQFRHFQFQTLESWPAEPVLNSLPLSHQCELVKYSKGKLVIKRVLLMEAEILSIREIKRLKEKN